jgi:hypothetical protein
LLDGQRLYWADQTVLIKTFGLYGFATHSGQKTLIHPRIPWIALSLNTGVQLQRPPRRRSIVVESGRPARAPIITMSARRPRSSD